MRNELVTYSAPKSTVSEIFKTLRTNVQYMNISRNRKSILVTSVDPGEGKSWVSANLAISFAQTGKKVILVDADMRKGRQHEIFEVSNINGLSNYLIFTLENSVDNVAKYLQKTAVDNLYLFSAGTVPPNPSELLTNAKMVDLIKTLEEMADIVIFDSTPSMMVTDAMILSRFVGGTLLVTSSKKTKIDSLKEIKKNIENVGGNITGVIVNKIPMSKRSYGRGYYYETSIEAYSSKKSKLKNFFDNLFSSNKGSRPIVDKQVKDNEIEQVKQKLENVEKEGKEKERIKEQEQEEADKNEKVKEEGKRKSNVSKEKNKEDKIATDAEIAVVLRKLSEYLEQK